MSAIDFIAALDAAPTRRWHYDATDRLPLSEEARQITMLRDLAMLAPGVLVWAVPNAGRRTRWEAGKMKREGVRAGITDLTLAWPGGVAFVEVKSGIGRPSPAQVEVLDTLHGMGHHCGVFRTSASLLDKLRAWGAPVANMR